MIVETEFNIYINTQKFENFIAWNFNWSEIES